MRMEFQQIVQAVAGNAQLEPCCEQTQVEGATWDSRTVRAGQLFCALPGERVDGYAFAVPAVKAGAAAVLVQRDADSELRDAAQEAGAGIIRVDDVACALASLAGAWRSSLTGTVIGLTGSSGKTTTKNLVRDVLAAGFDGRVVATRANQNNELGVPNTVLSADADTRALVVEMGMRGLGQICTLCEIVRPDWGLVTNVGTSHMELLGSRENIARAKAELFSALPHGGIAFVNAVDDYVADLCRFGDLDERGVTTVFFEGGDTWKRTDRPDVPACLQTSPLVWASDVSLDAQGRPRFVMHADRFEAIDRANANGTCECALELRGLHNVSNACSAAAVGLAAGLSLEQCCAALAESQPERGRQRIVCTPAGATVIDDSYNANPDSTCASLSTLSSLAVEGSRIAVLGDMGELGDYATEGHRRVGRCVAEQEIDALVCVGELSREIADAAKSAGMDPQAIACFDSVDSALAFTREICKSGDAVLVKASHFMGFDALAEGLVS